MRTKEERDLCSFLLMGLKTLDAVENPKVLIVDDEHIVADTLVLVFLKARYEARAAHSAEEALALTAGWTPKLAIIDVCLPAMNGVELAMRFRAEFPDCQILLFSGDPGAADLLIASPLPFPLLAKPVTPDEMLATASRFLHPAHEKKPDLIAGTAQALEKPSDDAPPQKPPSVH